MTIIERLHEMRNHGGEALTRGLPDEVILKFAERDPRLQEAVDVAWAEYQVLCRERPELMAMDERSQIADIHINGWNAAVVAFTIGAMAAAITAC